MVAETASHMGLIFLLLTLLTSGDPPPGQDFDCEAVLKQHNITLDEETLLKRLMPYDRKSVNNLITQLGHDDFYEREAAQKALESLGPPVLKYAREALESRHDLEIRFRCERIIDNSEKDPQSHAKVQLLCALVWALRAERSAKAVPVLTQLLVIGKPAIENAAAEALVTIGDRRILSELRNDLAAIKPEGRKSVRQNRALIRVCIELARGEELDAFAKFAGVLDRELNLLLLRRCAVTATDATWLRVLSRVSLAELETVPSEGSLLPFADKTLREIYGVGESAGINWHEFLQSPGLKPVLGGKKLRQVRDDFARAMDDYTGLLTALGSTKNFPLDTAALAYADIQGLRAGANAFLPERPLGNSPLIMRWRDILRTGAGEHYTEKIFFVASESASAERGWWGVIAQGRYDSGMQARFFGEVFMANPERFANGFLIGTGDKVSIPFCCGFTDDTYSIALFGPDCRAGVKNILDHLGRRSGTLIKNEKMHRLLVSSRETVKSQFWLLCLSVPGVSNYLKSEPLVLPFAVCREWRASASIGDDGSLNLVATAHVNPDAADWKKAAKKMAQFLKQQAGSDKDGDTWQNQLAGLLWSAAGDAQVRFKDNRVTITVRIEAKELQKKAAEFMNNTFIPGMLAARRSYLVGCREYMSLLVQRNKLKLIRLTRELQELEARYERERLEARRMRCSNSTLGAIDHLKKMIEQLRSPTFGGCVLKGEKKEMEEEIKLLDEMLKGKDGS